MVLTAGAFPVNGLLFLIPAGIIAIIFIQVILYGRKAKVRRALRKLAAHKISDFMEGEPGRISGRTVLAGKTVIAPLTGRECAYYYITVEEYRSHGKGGSWHTIIEEQGMGDIVVDDGSGYALIDHSSISAYLIEDTRFRSRTFLDATPELEHFLEKHGRKSTGLLGFNRSLRYLEGVLEAGEPFVVGGHAVWSTTQQHNLRLPAGRLLLITPHDHEPVYLTDDPSALRLWA